MSERDRPPGKEIARGRAGRVGGPAARGTRARVARPAGRRQEREDTGSVLGRVGRRTAAPARSRAAARPHQCQGSNRSKVSRARAGTATRRVSAHWVMAAARSVRSGASGREGPRNRRTTASASAVAEIVARSQAGDGSTGRASTRRSGIGWANRATRTDGERRGTSRR